MTARFTTGLASGHASVRAHFGLAAFGAIAFTIESWALGPYSWMYGYGSGLETIPAHLALSYEGRHFSLWAPFVAGGVDRLSFWGNADPLNVEPLLISLLPTWAANGLHRYLQYFIAIFFAARVAKEQLHLDRWWAGLVGIFHGCFSYFTFGEMLAFPAVPMLVWILARLYKAEHSGFAAIICGLAFSVFTTFTHSVPYLFVFALGWTALVVQAITSGAIIRLLLFFGGLTLGDSPQLLAALANATFSQRGDWPTDTITFSIDGLFYRRLHFDYFDQDPLLKVIMPVFPGALFLLGAALSARKDKRTALEPYAGRFLRVFVLYVLLSQKWAMVLLQGTVALVLPWVNGIYMGRFYTLPAAFLISCGAALTLRICTQLMYQHRLALRLGSTVVASFIVFMVLRPKWFLFYPLGVEGWGEKNYQVAALEDLKRRNTEPFRVASVLPLQPSYAYAQGLETSDGWVNLYPSVYRDLWLRVLAPLFQALPKNKEIFDPDGKKPQDHYIFLGADLLLPDIGLIPGEDPHQAIRNGFDIDRRFNLRILRLLNVRYLLSEYPLKSSEVTLVHSPDRQPVWPQSRDWATGHVNSPRPPITREHWLDQLSGPFVDYLDALQRKRAGKDLFIYELSGWIPRYRFVRNVLVADDASHALTTLEALSAEAAADTAVIRHSDARPFGNARSFEGGDVAVRRSAPDEITFDVRPKGPGLLLIANTWNPYWRVEVDGASRTLIRANHAQFGIPLQENDRYVRFYYDPPYRLPNVVDHPGPEDH